MNKKTHKNLAQSLREAIDMARLAGEKDKYGNNWGMSQWPMNDAYCSYKGCDFQQTIAIAVPGQKCPHCKKPLSWSGKWLVDKEIELEDGRKRTIRVREYREPLRKWKKSHGSVTSTPNTETSNTGSNRSEELQPG